jgi:hypothetical protein
VLSAGASTGVLTGLSIPPELTVRSTSVKLGCLPVQPVAKIAHANRNPMALFIFISCSRFFLKSDLVYNHGRGELFSDHPARAMNILPPGFDESTQNCRYFKSTVDRTRNLLDFGDIM